MTWNQLVTGLRDIQTRATADPDALRAFVQLGWASGRDGGPDGYVLTARGREILRRAPALGPELTQLYEQLAGPLPFPWATASSMGGDAAAIQRAGAAGSSAEDRESLLRFRR